MIYSDKQFTVSTLELEKLRNALTKAEERKSDEAWLKKVQVDALKSQIATLEAEMSHYNLLKSGEISFSKAHSLENLPSMLVQARIAAGLNQSELAEQLGLKPQQIQRYEASNYAGASLGRLIDVSKALKVHTTGLFESEEKTRGAVFSWANIEDVVWKQFPAQEMAKRGWFDVPRKADVHQLARNYFMRAAGPQFATAYHRKKMHGGSVPNEFALLAWQARILERAQGLVKAHHPPEFIHDDRWIADLVALTRRRDGPKLAQRFLMSKGIILTTERHLSSTYLDGGAMLDQEGRPIIGLTLRYDRLDNFWFVLLHELGHVFIHLMNGLHYDFFDEEGTAGNDVVEVGADQFALEFLIPEARWNECLSRFALSEEAVRIDAATLGIDPSIIAGRIRKERGDYTILKSLIGQGQVASQFEDGDDVLI